MKRLAASLARERAGTAAIEFAIAAPVIFILLFGMAQMGLLFLAKAGLEQGVEAGARYASIYPRPSKAQIEAKVLANVYGVDRRALTGPTITYGTDNNVPYARITLRYTYRFDLAFVPIGPLELVHTRRVYQV